MHLCVHLFCIIFHPLLSVTAYIIAASSLCMAEFMTILMSGQSEYVAQQGHRVTPMLRKNLKPFFKACVDGSTCLINTLNKQKFTTALSPGTEKNALMGNV